MKNKNRVFAALICLIFLMAWAAACGETGAETVSPVPPPASSAPPAPESEPAGGPKTPESQPADGAADQKPAETEKPAEVLPAGIQPEETPPAEAEEPQPAGAEDLAAPPAPVNTVTLSISADQDVFLAAEQVELEEGDSVFALTRRAAERSGLYLDVRGGGKTAYVMGIGELYEFDGGPESGWIFMVNGDARGTGAGAYFPQAGDVIEWKYTRALGRDLGQGLD
jgi:hypothetical protein